MFFYFILNSTSLKRGPPADTLELNNTLIKKRKSVGKTTACSTSSMSDDNASIPVSAQVSHDERYGNLRGLQSI